MSTGTPSVDDAGASRTPAQIGSRTNNQKFSMFVLSLSECMLTHAGGGKGEERRGAKPGCFSLFLAPTGASRKEPLDSFAFSAPAFRSIIASADVLCVYDVYNIHDSCTTSYSCSHMTALSLL